MAVILSKFAQSKYPIAYATYAGEISVNDYFVDLTAADQVAGNIIDLGELPAYHTVTDAILIPGTLGAAITLDVGIMSGTFGTADNTRTMGAEIFAASTAAQAGTVARPTLATAFTILPSERNRSIGVKIVTAPTTPVAGRIRLRVYAHTADQNVQF